MVHRREVEGEELVLGNQGDLFRNAMTWWDHSTGSVWSQPLGEAILGPRKGQRLELLPSSLTEWGEWRELYPDTLALDAAGGRAGFDLDQMMIAVDLGDEAVAYPIPDVRSRGSVSDEVAGVPLVVVADPGRPQRWAVFSRTLDDRVVELELRDGELVDPDSGTTWNADRGFGIDGPLRDQQLDLLPAFTVFPGDLHSFWPGARIWSPR